MKKIIFIGLLLVLASCTDNSAFNEGKAQLESMGYTKVTNTGYEFMCCGKGDDYSTGFTAISSNGRTVEGCFCSGLFKGLTIRFK